MFCFLENFVGVFSASDRQRSSVAARHRNAEMSFPIDLGNSPSSFNLQSKKAGSTPHPVPDL
jgi:hypothetical protein